MACPEVTIQTILGTECIGDSLPKINTNFSELGDATCDLITKVNTLSSSKANNLSVVDSPTIDLSYNSTTGILSAVTTSFVATSSSPIVAKAWVVFDGFATFPATLANSGIKAAYNVSSVTEAQLGAYDINFQTPFDTSEYAIAGSACAATPDPAAKRGFYPGGKSSQTTTKCRIETSISGGGTGLSESDRVYVIIFSN